MITDLRGIKGSILENPLHTSCNQLSYKTHEILNGNVLKTEGCH